MVNWTEKTLGEICDQGGGFVKTGPFGSQLHQSDYKDVGTPVVMPKNIIEDKVDEADIARIGEEDLERLSQHQLKSGDIVYGRRGDIGRHALITQKEEGWLCGTGCLRIHLGKESPVGSGYLHYYLKQPQVIEWIYNQAVGATMPNLNTSILRSAPVIYPDTEIQHKIASTLSAYDDLIENNLRRIRILEEMAQLIYREWFVKFRFPGHEKVKMVDSPLGEIPKDWEIKKLEELVNTQYGYTESAQEDPVGPKFLRGMDINKHSYIDWSSVPYCPIEKSGFEKFKLETGDIVVIRMADPGKVGIVEKNIDAVFASYLVRLNIKSDMLSPYYLFYFLLSDRYQGYITGASTGTTRKSASAGVMVGIDLLLPPSHIRRKFDEIVADYRKMLDNLLEQNANLRQTRDLLLPKLISGQLDVSELDIDIRDLAV